MSSEQLPIVSWELNDDGSYGKDIYGIFVIHSTDLKYI